MHYPDGKLNCWEIMDCGRGPGGSKIAEKGACVAASEGMGHYCWAIAGTLCGGKVLGDVDEKSGTCLLCPVFKEYNSSTGALGTYVQKKYPHEHIRYQCLLKTRATH